MVLWAVILRFGGQLPRIHGIRHTGSFNTMPTLLVIALDVG